MFIPWHHPAVRLTGRWSRLESDVTDPHIFVKPTARVTVTTAPGSSFEAAFTGEWATLLFDTGYQGYPAPHLWIRVDGGAYTEAPVDRFLKLRASGTGAHTVTVIYKGGSEVLPRWYQTLMGCVSFLGLEADAPAELKPDERKIIEFVGDSITEGVLADADYSDRPASGIDQFNRVYQDDCMATYAWICAEELNLRPIFQAYGAVGLTREGNGSVPRAGLIYPYVFDHVPYTGEKPDYIVINHGANDRGTSAREYILRYGQLIALAHEINPDAQIVCLGAFCGAFDRELGQLVSDLNKPFVRYISTRGWLPPEPLHPLRAGHREAGQRLAVALNEMFDL